MPRPFWETKTLEELSQAEWESLCDGCGRCCLYKLADREGGEVFHTDIACPLLNTETCRCSDYTNRFERFPACIALTPANVREFGWLPPTCAYRRVAEGRGLAWWHPLVSGRPETVHEAGVSVQGRVIPPDALRGEDAWDRWVDWPGEDVDDAAKEPGQARKTGSV
ncbi:MAG: YcgN family cysteine cluster protein [Aquisalimonadaceae bacterium]